MISAQPTPHAGQPELTPRERLIEAMAASVVEKGYRQTTVADVVRIARTSRRTFYEHFAGRDECYLALFTETIEHTMERIAGAIRPDAPWAGLVDDAIDAYIAGVTADPALQMSFVRELPGLGPQGADQQREVIERFAKLLVALVAAVRSAQADVPVGPLSLDMAIVIVGGLRELLVISLQQGRSPAELRGTARQVVKSILLGGSPAG